MAYRCVLRQCPNFKGRPNEDNRGFRCHKFPKDLKQFKLWEDWVIEKHVVGTTKISKVSGLCSAHFSEDSYRPHTIRLKDDAVPSIAPPLTADIAFKLGMISRQEEFSQLASAGSETARPSTSVGAVSTPQTPNIAREGSTGESVRPLGVDELCVGTLSVQGVQCQTFQINRRKRRLADDYQDDSLPDCARNKQKCSTPLADQGKVELSSGDALEDSDTSTSEDDNSSGSDSEVDPADISHMPTSATNEGMVKCSARRCGNTHEGGFVMTRFSEDEERSAGIDPDIPSDKKVQLEVKQLNRKPKLTGDPVSAASVSCHMVSKHSVQTSNKARKDASSTKDIFERISEPDNKAENCEMSPAKTEESEESAKQKNKKLKRQIREMKLALRKNKALVKHLEIVSVLELCRELRESADLDVTKSNG